MELQETKTRAKIYAEKTQTEVAVYKTENGFGFIERCLAPKNRAVLFLYKPRKSADSKIPKGAGNGKHKTPKQKKEPREQRTLGKSE